jgi:hypothetical protein
VVLLRKSPDLIQPALEQLKLHLTSLATGDREPLARRIYDTALALAETSPGRDDLTFIEPAERDFLGELRRLLGLPSDAAKGPSDEVSPPVDPAAWAAGWTEAMADASFELLSGMHAHHEREWQAGYGLLDQAKCLSDLPATQEAPICDQGVLVFPRSWSNRKIRIIGDLHGDLRALESVLKLAGAGKDGFQDDAVMLFLGDYGDRGAGTLAVWLRLASLKQRFPNRVFLLRGNHEETALMRLTRADTGRVLNTPWHVPTTSNMESYLMLAMAMLGNIADVASLYAQIPDVALLPDGIIALHGSLPPRWKEGDGWSGSDEDKSALTIQSLADLRKPAVRGAVRWTDFTDRDEVIEGWRDHARGSRLFADRQDLAHWRGLLGEFRMVHGHTHPSEGSRWEDDKRVLALNTSRHTVPNLAIATLHHGVLETLPVA